MLTRSLTDYPQTATLRRVGNTTRRAATFSAFGATAILVALFALSTKDSTKLQESAGSGQPIEQPRPNSVSTELVEFGQVVRSRETLPGLASNVVSEATVTKMEATATGLPIAYDHPQIIANIRARQGALSVYQQALTTGVAPGSMSLDKVACAASELAILTILDATGRSEVVEGKIKAPPPTEDSHFIVSGNAAYQIPVGEFPEYDRIRELRNVLHDGVPLGEIDLPAVERRVEHALSYSVARDTSAPTSTDR